MGLPILTLQIKNKAADKMFTTCGWLEQKLKELTWKRAFIACHFIICLGHGVTALMNIKILSVFQSVCLSCTHATICCGVCKSMEQHVISLTANDRSLRPCYVALVWDQLPTGAFKLIWSTGRSSSFHLSSHRLGRFKSTCVY